MKKNITLVCLICFLGLSCKKDAPTVEGGADNSGFVPVLKSNSGFSQVYDAKGAEINLNDFTVEANDNLNVLHYTVTRTQQSNFNTQIRATKNLKTGKEVALPDYASPSSGVVRDELKLTSTILEEFRPYSNFLASGTYRSGNSSYNFQATFGGDITGGVKIANPLGYPSLGFYYPSLDALNTGQSYYGVGVPTPNHLFKVVNFSEGAFNNGTKTSLIKTILESRISANNNGTPMQFDVGKTSVVAYETSISDRAVKNKKGEIAFSNELTNTDIKRHYSSDGKILVLLIKDTQANTYWAVSYDFITNTLTKLFDKTALDYGAAGSDVDCDENGNLFYTGLADNGKNSTGISVYKKDKTGITTVVGTDNFLKFGEVIKLKALHGKVYLALRGKITGASDFQLSILKQN